MLPCPLAFEFKVAFALDIAESEKAGVGVLQHPGAIPFTLYHAQYRALSILSL